MSFAVAATVAVAHAAQLGHGQAMKPPRKPRSSSGRNADRPGAPRSRPKAGLSPTEKARRIADSWGVAPDEPPAKGGRKGNAQKTARASGRPEAGRPDIARAKAERMPRSGADRSGPRKPAAGHPYADRTDTDRARPESGRPDTRRHPDEARSARRDTPTRTPAGPRPERAARTLTPRPARDMPGDRRSAAPGIGGERHANRDDRQRARGPQDRGPRDRNLGETGPRAMPRRGRPDRESGAADGASFRSAPRGDRATAPRRTASAPGPSAARARAQATPRAADEPQRIAKLLARAGVASRREIERMIAEGRVALDGVPIDTPATLLTTLRGVSVDGAPVAEAEAPRLFLFHKPAGCLTAERDPAGRPTIYDRLPAQGLPRLMPVGRLDMTTEGLLLLTNDGELKRRLELPSTGVERSYRARAFGTVSQDQLEALIEGVEVDGMHYGRIDANLERRTGHNQWIEMTLTEGKNREVRRVLEYLGLKVNRLIRTRYGPFNLGDSAPGALMEVKPADLDAFVRSLTKKGGPRGAAAEETIPGGPQ